MKKILMIAVIFSLSLAAYGQRGGVQKEMSSPEERAERMTNRMEEQLGLSEDQKQKIYQINLQNAQSRDVEMENRRDEAKQRRENRQHQMQEQNKEIETILTPEQVEKWGEIRDSNRQRGPMMREGRGSQKNGEFRKGRGKHRGDTSNRGYDYSKGKRAGKNTDI